MNFIDCIAQCIDGKVFVDRKEASEGLINILRNDNNITLDLQFRSIDLILTKQTYHFNEFKHVTLYTIKEQQQGVINLYMDITRKLTIWGFFVDMGKVYAMCLNSNEPDTNKPIIFYIGYW